MSASPGPGQVATPGAESGRSRVLVAVNEFYEVNPFPGFDPGKYETRQDLVTRASWYARRVDAEIPFGASVIDVGCGTGQLACFLALKGRRVLGVDYSQHSLAARGGAEAAPRARATCDFRRENILAWDLPARAFDYVFCNGVLHHTSDPYGGFQNLVEDREARGPDRRGPLQSLRALDARRAPPRREAALAHRSPGQGPRHREAARRARRRRGEAPHLVRRSVRAPARVHPHGRRGARLVSRRTASSTSRRSRRSSCSARCRSASSGRARSRGWRSGRLAHLLVQLAWILTQNAGGGYFVLVGRKRVMNILGISSFYHDAAACLIRDGVVVAAASEERFTRKKHDASFPRQAIEYCLERGQAAGRRPRLRRLLREALRQVQAHPVLPARLLPALLRVVPARDPVLAAPEARDSRADPRRSCGTTGRST